MSYASPTNNFDFESLFLEEEQEVPLNFYQSPTESLLSTSSSGTDHTNSSNEQQQQQITYDVISDGYVFGNDFDINAQKQKGLKQDDLAAANPFFNQANNNQFSPLNPLNNFLYNQNQKPGYVGYQNPQLMGQLGMYFPQNFPSVFPQFGNQPFPFPNNNLLYTSPNTSPIGLATSPNSNNSTGVNPSSNPSSNSTTSATTQPTETKTKASRRKSAKKNTKSNNSTTTTTTATPTSSAKAEESTTTTPSTTPEPKSTKTSTPEPSDSDNSNHSSEKENDSSSSSGNKSDEKKRKRKSKKDAKALTPEEEKELKRQRRLIKNRESAQASRERKKIYIQGLEKKVDGLAQEFNELQGHVSTLEEENEILRQRLKMLGEVVEEPSHKKRKMIPMTSSGHMKVPIPMDSRSFVNPFMMDFWSLFGMQQQLQQAQQPTPDLAQLNPRAASSSRRVVMFIMLFCVAMFLVLPHSSDIKFDSQPSTSTTEQPESVTSRLSPASRKLASTEQKETMVDVSIDASQKPFVDEDFKKNVAEIYQTFQELRSEASETNEEESTDKSIVNDFTSRINVVFDTDKVSLSFPKSILVKKEESDSEMVDDEMITNSTYDEKIASLSTRLLKEICRTIRD